MIRPVRGEAWTPSVLFGQEDRYKTPLLFEARREPGIFSPGLLGALRALLLPFVAPDKRKFWPWMASMQFLQEQKTVARKRSGAKHHSMN